MMEQEFDFSSTTDEELEAFLDAIIETEYIPALEENKKAQIINIKRQKEFFESCKIIKYLFKDSDVVINCGLDETFPNIGVIEIIGKNTVVLKNTKLMSKVGKLATNFEVSPKLDGTIDMSFSFYGMTCILDNLED